MRVHVAALYQSIVLVYETTAAGCVEWDEEVVGTGRKWLECPHIYRKA